jgi:trigger factor
MASDATVKATVTELPESRVRVEAQVNADEVERRLQETARSLGRDMRMPGFRKGKVPSAVVIRRVGREAVLDETVRDALSRWYLEAIEAAGIHPVGDPQLSVADLPAEGEPLTFTIEIGVRPVARLGTYKGVEVGRREPVADQAAVDAELEALRQGMARLATVDRPAEAGDFVVIDYRGTVEAEESGEAARPFPGGEGRDQLVELGSGRLIPGFEEGIVGATAGEERHIDVTFPEDYPAQQLAGRRAQFAVTVREVKAKELPGLDDDLASEAGFDTLAELRDDVAVKLRETDERRIEAEFREAVVDAVAAEASVEIPPTLVEARAREMWERMLHALAHQNISKEAYLRITAKTEEEVIAEARPDAEQALRRAAVIAAVVEAEAIAPSDDDVLEVIRASAEREGTTPEKLRDRLAKAGQLELLREDLAERAAIDLLVEHAQPITVEQAQARQKLWTPGKGEPGEPGGPPAKAGPAGRLWTPGS